MRKLFLSLLLVLPLCGFAQKGMQGVGVNLGIGSLLRGGNLKSPSISYQKHLGNKVRVSSSVGWLYGNGNLSFDGYYGIEGTFLSQCFITTGINYFFNQPHRLRPYAIGGLVLGFGEGHYDFDDVTFGVELGLGVVYRLNYDIAVQCELPFIIPISWAPNFTIPALSIVYTF